MDNAAVMNVPAQKMVIHDVEYQAAAMKRNYSSNRESNEGRNVRNLWYAFVPKRLITYFYPLLLWYDMLIEYMNTGW